MKTALKSTFLLLLTLSFAILPACFDEEEPQGRYQAHLSENPTQNQQGNFIAVFQVSGMGCMMCEGRIKQALADKEGVIDVSASKTTELVTVTYDNYLINSEQIKNYIEAIK